MLNIFTHHIKYTKVNSMGGFYPENNVLIQLYYSMYILKLRNTCISVRWSWKGRLEMKESHNFRVYVNIF